MTHEKATALGVRAEEVAVGCFSGKYGNDWIAYVPDGERGRRVLTQGNVYSVSQWAEGLRRFQAEGGVAS